MLLPERYSNIFKREKIIHLISSLFVFLIFVLIVGIVFLLPSYFTLLFSSSDVLRRTNTEGISLERRDVLGVESEIAQINLTSDSYFLNEESRREFSGVLLSFVNVAFEEIKLINIEFQMGSEGEFVFHIRGEAQKRSDLILYSQKLRGLPQIKELRSPVSNLLQEKNVKFLLEAVINPQYYDYKN